jgi:uncharacterized protein YndB with AHSA1/START domain
MPITEIVSNAEALTLTVVAEYSVPVDRLWDAYSDPRQIERFWGPPDWPATFTRHDMTVGGQSQYYMTGPDGTLVRGRWDMLAITPLGRLELEDAFADETGDPTPDMPPMHVAIAFENTDTGSRFTSVTTFASVDAMQAVIDMGVLEGIKSAMAQIDAVLADLHSFAAGRATEAQRIGDTQVRISRTIRGTPEQVWRAHHDADLMKRWMLGPDGWTMPVCDIAHHVGDRFRYEWAKADGTERFGFEGELLESHAPHREVSTELMSGTDGPPTRNEMTLVPVQGGVLLSLVITYASNDMREMVLGTGMTAGMEQSYARLERVLVAA